MQSTYLRNTTAAQMTSIKRSQSTEYHIQGPGDPKTLRECQSCRSPWQAVSEPVLGQPDQYFQNESCSNTCSRAGGPKTCMEQHSASTRQTKSFALTAESSKKPQERRQAQSLLLTCMGASLSDGASQPGQPCYANCRSA